MAADHPTDLTCTDEPAVRPHPYVEFLASVQKPGRYLGGEEQACIKAPSDAHVCRFVLAFPDLYEIGMSHLGTRILYDLINTQDDLVCERAFSPWLDMERELRNRGLPLVSLETYTPLHAFDVVGVSLQYELSYTNVLLNLELGGIPLRSAARSDADPFVIAGGPTATHPEPLAAFIDCFLVGEAEEVLPELLRRVGRGRRAGRPRAAILADVAQLPGVYVPAYYEVAEDDRTGLQVVVGRTEAGVAAGAPERIERAWVRDLDAFPFPERFPVPYAEAIFDRAAVEIARGCTEGCRFCQAGIIYRPVRERDPQAVMKAVLGGIDNAGFTSTSLTALSTADVSSIDPLIKALVPELAARKVELGVASLRAYGLNESLLDEVKRVGINGLTFAPEAGTQRMRDVINKNVSDDDILASAQRIFARGYDRMKLYFIIGLPTETDEDVVGIVDTGIRVKQVARQIGSRRPPKITLSVSQHVPKPHTPFQWAAMDSMEDLVSKTRMLHGLAKRHGLSIKTHDVQESWLECLYARGDRRMGDVLETAFKAGARFDGWKEAFVLETWLDALATHGIEPERYTRTLPVGARLPWDHIEIGLEPDFLASEWRKAIKGRVSPPCGKPFGAQVHHPTLAQAQAESRRLVCYDCGIACDLTDMRDERIDFLRTLELLREPNLAVEAAPQGTRPEGAERERARAGAAESETDDDEMAAQQSAMAGRDDATFVPLARLTASLAKSNLHASSAFKASAEAPHSRLRLFFAKQDTLRYLGHRDLLRIIPRMFRRAGVEIAFSRGYNPIPRMSFAPALALGVAAAEEVLDVDVLLPESVRDMTGELDDASRSELARSLLEALRVVAPPGMVLLDARLLVPHAARLGQLIAAADYVVDLTPEQTHTLEHTLASRLSGAPIVVERKPHRKHRNSVDPAQQFDIRPVIVSASLDRERQRLHFRLRVDGSSGARPREVAWALTGQAVPEHRLQRACLLALRGSAFVSLRELPDHWSASQHRASNVAVAIEPAP